MPPELGHGQLHHLHQLPADELVRVSDGIADLEVIVVLADDEPLRTELGTAAARYVHAHHAIEGTAEPLAALYRALAVSR